MSLHPQSVAGPCLAGEVLAPGQDGCAGSAAALFAAGHAAGLVIDLRRLGTPET